MKKKKKQQPKRQPKFKVLDCYGIQPNSCKMGKITTSDMYDGGIFKELGELGKW